MTVSGAVTTRARPPALVLIANASALRRRLAIDIALDREHGIDALDRFDCDRRLVEGLSLAPPIVLPRLNGRPIMAYCSRLVGSATMDAFDPCQAIVVLVGLELQATSIERDIARAFGLTVAEARIDLSRLIGECVDAYRQTNSGIGFRLEAPKDVCAEADATLIREAIGNLLGNAASYARHESTVELVLKREGQSKCRRRA